MIPVQHHVDYLSSFGRNGDNTLMHVSHDEVRYLSGLGALTRNPVTGLPEAFQLSDLLPIAGLAASFFGGPLLGAAVGGIGTAIHSHSLGQGLLAGIGSYGLGSLLGAAGGSAAGAVGDAAGDTGGAAATATAAAAPNAGSLAANPAYVPVGGAPPVDPSIGNLGGSAAGGAAVTGAAPGAGSFAGNLQSNLGSADFWAANKPAAYMAGAGLYGQNMMAERQAQQQAADSINASNAAHQRQLHQNYLSAAQQANAVSGYSNPYFASDSPYMYATGGMTGDGGLYNLHSHMHGMNLEAHHPHDGISMRSVYQTPGFSTGALVGDNGRWAPEEAHGVPPAQHGPHGIEGLLKGPGDGMSDDIPARIDGHQPARLATDEFVIPADVVSHLGNGSTSAGAKHLYDMLDRVRKARVGHDKQGKQINAHEHLPA
jgi:hypothetical protein